MRDEKTMAFVALGLLLGACNNNGGSGSGDASDSMSTAPLDESGETTPTSVGTTTSDGTSATSPEDSSDEGNNSSNQKHDVLAVPDVPGQAGNCTSKSGGSATPEFSYLWASNSSEGTISKIDTRKVIEVGRYQTRPDTAGSPSRTSVSLSGNVAVANRSGGVSKFYARTEACAESNGTPGIQTSDGTAALPWDEEECRAWFTEFDYDSNRPVAWAPGELNKSTCTWQNEELWTAGRYGQSGAEVVLMDGDTGAVIDIAEVDGLKSDPYGLYGGAVDSEGNFWATGWASGNHLVRVDRQSMDVTVYDGPTQATGVDSHWYGMTVDINGYVWNCASRAARFDPDTEEWEVSDELPVWSAGCMADADEDGLLWMGASYASVLGIDRETFEVVHDWPTPDSYGISIDYDGFVWAVNGSGAHKVDPETGDVVSYNGLYGAYTYSDMTGYALAVVGGFPPSG